MNSNIKDSSGQVSNISEL